MVRCFPADWLHPQPPLTPTIGPSRQANAIGVWTPCAGLMLGLVSCPVMGVLSSLFYEGRSGQSTAQAHTAKTRLSLDSNSGLSDSVLCPQPHTPRPSWEQERLPGEQAAPTGTPPSSAACPAPSPSPGTRCSQTCRTNSPSASDREDWFLLARCPSTASSQQAGPLLVAGDENVTWRQHCRPGSQVKTWPPDGPAQRPKTIIREGQIHRSRLRGETLSPWGGSGASLKEGTPDGGVPGREEGPAHFCLERGSHRLQSVARPRNGGQKGTASGTRRTGSSGGQVTDRTNNACAKPTA